MTVGVQTYTKLLQDFGEISQDFIDQDILGKLKAEHQETINSKRTLENIVDIKSLLKVLEKRGILQHDDISVLHDIAQLIRNKSVDDLIVNYEEWLSNNISSINNLYSRVTVPQREEHLNTSANPFESKMPLFPPNGIPNFSTTCVPSTSMSVADREKELQSLVINKISRRIGKFWAEVSRRLDIDEVNIDEIENRYLKDEKHRHEKMFKEALNIYFSEEHSNWKKILMRALETSKRRDLKEEVEKIVY